MEEPIRANRPTGCEIAAWVMAAAAMIAVLTLHLLPMLLAGMLVYEIVHALSARLRIGRFRGRRARIAVIVLLAVIITVLLSMAIWGGISIFHSRPGNLSELLEKMAEILDQYRETLPSWLKDFMPVNAEGAREGLVLWLRDHAKEVQVMGKEAGVAAVHVLIGMVIGAMMSVREVAASEGHRPLAAAISEQAARFGLAFRSVVFAQVRISALNTIFAALYLAVLLPLFGVKLPLIKTMVAITFIAGLLPVVGNVISNTVIVIVSLSYSLPAAGASLAFLVIIHKLEYFLNARIIGTKIHAHAWELLIVMVAMEAAFGIAGVVAAPIYYAYIKGELSDRGLV